MKLPRLLSSTASRTTRDLIREFRGYNRGLVISDNEFYNTFNITGDEYPIVTQRARRGTFKDAHAHGGIYGYGKWIYWVEDGVLKSYDGSTILGREFPITPAVTSDRIFVGMGGYMVIFPEKLYINTTDEATSVMQSLDAENTTSGNVSVSLCDLDGEAINAPTEKPANPANGDYWVDTSTGTLMQWSSASSMWVQIPTTYIAVTSTGIGVGLKKGDGVEISGLAAPSLNGSYIIYAVTDDSIVYTGFLNGAYTQTDPVTVSRKAPDMDFVVEYNNRLWGCSSAKHEIYACKLGDPTNWRCYEGLASDSYAVTVGSPEEFTGAAVLGGNILFFKEDKIIKIFGTAPSNFQLIETRVPGISKGSHKSPIVIGNILYYLSERGVMAYDGSLPYLISDAFGSEKYMNGVAGTTGGKYYISMMNALGEQVLMVYDPSKGFWVHEDNTKAVYMTTWDQALVYTDDYQPTASYELPRENIHYFGGRLWVDEAPFNWELESGDIGLDLPDQKWVSRIVLRMKVEKGGYAILSVSYDDGVFTPVERIDEHHLDSIVIPVKPRRCDHMRYKLSGRGQFRLYSISKVIEQSSEVHTWT